MTLTIKTDEVMARASANIVGLLRDTAEALPAPERMEEFGTAFDRFGNARLVLLGEATHGTSEFYRARAAITRHLIQHHGFTIVAVEADWPDAVRIDRYVRHLRHVPIQGPAFSRFPSWMWRNVEVLEFLNWLRAENDSRPPASRVEFRGLDIYSLGASMSAVLNYLDRVDPEAARRARWRYGCLTPWQRDPAHYGHRALMGADTCESDVVAQLHELLVNRLAYIKKDGEDFFDAAQNARIVRAAEEYYRIMYHGSAESWNLRDRHMFNTLQSLISRRGTDAKAVVWAHNSHIGNAAATEMSSRGEHNIGQLCHQEFGRSVYSIGFGTNSGGVAAASNWDGPMEIKTVKPALRDSYEHLCHESGVRRFCLDLRAASNKGLEDLRNPRLERAIGVIYRPESELASHYFQATLPQQFDEFIWFDDTKAVAPFDTKTLEDMPDTYPFGI